MSDIKSAELIEDQILWLRKDVGTTPMHLVKLVYIAHGWMLGRYDCSLICEDVEAWTYGPVIPSTYHRYKSFGGDEITSNPVDQTKDFTKEQSEHIQEVVNAYQGYSAITLSAITHQPGTPWDIARREFGTGCIIPNDVIKRYYKKLADEGPKKSK
ncbi:MAG: hypothetical protein M2R45_01252 [Verrucomicrobia subdivision 3 bacterium]|nr:hypothetical protein [Limisphaerales bacterium]MCS1415123.1 hypothetical protein [Limisphaerales bacterium]